MKGVVKKWGNSAAIRIPSVILQSLRLRVDDAVDVRDEDGKIVIEPVRRRCYDLDVLLQGITASNQHEAADFGESVGKELW